MASSELDELRAQLERSRAEGKRLERLVQSAPGALVCYCRSPEGRSTFSYVSAGIDASLGLSAEALEQDAQLLFDRIHPDDRAALWARHAESARSGEPWLSEFRFEHPQRGEIWVVGNLRRCVEPDGTLLWHGILIEITRRKHIEDSLAVAEAQLRLALEAADMGAWIFDPQNNRIWGNRSQRRMWETPDDAPEWFALTASRSRIHREDFAACAASLQDALKGEAVQGEFRLVRSDGSIRWISSRARASLSPGRQPRVTGINVDITQQKLAGEKAMRSHKLEALGTLAGGIAHDFNNVLFVIGGNASVALAAHAAGKDPTPMLLEIDAAGRRAADLVRQILAFSRPQEQKASVIRLADPVHEALRLVRSSTSSNVEFSTDFDDNTPPVLADTSRLGQIVINLGTNAVHAIGKGAAGRVHVRLAAAVIRDGDGSDEAHVPPGRYALLSMTDTGCGMSEATLARIYDPFFTTKPPGEGTGLGLSVVHGIIKALGAHMTVQSRPGAGTTFNLYLRAAGESAVPASELSGPELPRGRGQRVMFVDDEPTIIRMATSLLESLGYSAEGYETPEHALVAMRRDPLRYDAVITDLSMPVLSGFELARALLAIRPQLPIVLMSGNLGPEERALAKELGLRATVLKPPSVSALAVLLAGLF